MAIIEVNNVTKEYQLGHLKSLKQGVLNTFGRLRGQEVEKPKPFKALDDVSFKVEAAKVFTGRYTLLANRCCSEMA